MSAYVDYEIGSWMLQQDDGRTIALITDLNAFRDTSRTVRESQNIDDLHYQFDKLIKIIEFAPVTVMRDGTVKWKNGDFVN